MYFKQSLIPILLISVFLINSCATVYADEWTNSHCLNKTHLFLFEKIQTSNGVYLANTTKYCQHGCDNETASCVNPYVLNGIQANFSLTLYLFLFGSGIAALYYGAFRERKHLILMFWSTIIFIVLSLQSVAFESIFANTFFAGLTGIFVMLCLLLSVVALIFTLVGIVSFISDRRSSEL